MTRFAFPALLLLAAAPLFAQKPEAGGEVERWRERGVALCVAELRSVDGLSPDALEAICGCAFARLDPPRTGGALPALAPGRPLRQAMGGAVAFCTFERAPERVQDVARWSAGADPPPPVATPPAPPPAPADPGKPAAADEDLPPPAAAPGFDLSAWWNGLAWPSWLSGLPKWSLGLLALIAFFLLRGSFRRDSSRDLSAPPAHMRPRGPR